MNVIMSLGMDENLVASMTARITLDQQDVFEQAVQALNKTQNTLNKKGNFLEYRITANRKQLDEVLNEIRNANPKLGTSVVLDFDKSDFERKLSRLKSYSGETGKKIGELLSKEMDSAFKDIDVSQIFKELSTTSRKSVKEFNRIVADLETKITGFSFDGAQSLDDIDEYFKALKQLQVLQNKLPQDKKYANVKFSFNAEELDDIAKAHYKKAGQFIRKNNGALTSNITEQYNKEFGNLIELIQSLNSTDLSISTSGISDAMGDVSKQIDAVTKKINDLKTSIKGFNEEEFASKLDSMREESFDLIDLDYDKKINEILEEFKNYVSLGGKIEKLSSGFQRDLLDGMFDGYENSFNTDSVISATKELENAQKELENLKNGVNNSTPTNNTDSNSEEMKQMLSDMEKLKKSLDEVNSKYEEQQKKIENLTNEKNKLVEKNKNSVDKGSYNEIVKSLEEAKQKASEYKTMLDNANKSCEDLSKAIEKLGGETDANGLLEITKKIEQYETQLGIVNKLLEEQNSKNEELTNELKNANNSNLSLQKELEEDKSKYIDIIKSLEDEIANSKAKQAKQTSNTDNANKNVKTTQPKADGYSELLKKHEEVKKYIEETKKKIQESVDIINAYNNSVDGLTGIIKEITDKYNKYKGTETEFDYYDMAVKKVKDVHRDKKYVDRASVYYGLSVEQNGKKPIYNQNNEDISDFLYKRYLEIVELEKNISSIPKVSLDERNNAVLKKNELNKELEKYYKLEKQLRSKIAKAEKSIKNNADKSPVEQNEAPKQDSSNKPKKKPKDNIEPVVDFNAEEIDEESLNSLIDSIFNTADTVEKANEKLNKSSSKSKPKQKPKPTNNNDVKNDTNKEPKQDSDSNIIDLNQTANVTLNPELSKTFKEDSDKLLEDVSLSKNVQLVPELSEDFKQNADNLLQDVLDKAENEVIESTDNNDVSETIEEKKIGKKEATNKLREATKVFDSIEDLSSEAGKQAVVAYVEAFNEASAVGIAQSNLDRYTREYDSSIIDEYKKSLTEQNSPIDSKTEAFKNEQQVVEEVANKEVESLNSVKEAVLEIKNEVENLATATKELPPIKLEVKETKVEDANNSSSGSSNNGKKGTGETSKSNTSYKNSIKYENQKNRLLKKQYEYQSLINSANELDISQKSKSILKAEKNVEAIKVAVNYLEEKISNENKYREKYNLETADGNNGLQKHKDELKADLDNFKLEVQAKESVESAHAENAIKLYKEQIELLKQKAELSLGGTTNEDIVDKKFDAFKKLDESIVDVDVSNVKKYLDEANKEINKLIEAYDNLKKSWSDAFISEDKENIDEQVRLLKEIYRVKTEMIGSGNNKVNNEYLSSLQDELELVQSLGEEYESLYYGNERQEEVDSAVYKDKINYLKKLENYNNNTVDAKSSDSYKKQLKLESERYKILTDIYKYESLIISSAGTSVNEKSKVILDAEKKLESLKLDLQHVISKINDESAYRQNNNLDDPNKHSEFIKDLSSLSNEYLNNVRKIHAEKKVGLEHDKEALRLYEEQLSVLKDKANLAVSNANSEELTKSRDELFDLLDGNSSITATNVDSQLKQAENKINKLISDANKHVQNTEKNRNKEIESKSSESYEKEYSLESKKNELLKKRYELELKIDLAEANSVAEKSKSLLTAERELEELKVQLDYIDEKIKKEQKYRELENLNDASKDVELSNQKLKLKQDHSEYVEQINEGELVSLQQSEDAVKLYEKQLALLKEKANLELDKLKSSNINEKKEDLFGELDKESSKITADNVESKINNATKRIDSLISSSLKSFSKDDNENFDEQVKLIKEIYSVKSKLLDDNDANKENNKSYLSSLQERLRLLQQEGKQYDVLYQKNERNQNINAEVNKSKNSYLNSLNSDATKINNVISDTKVKLESLSNTDGKISTYDSYFEGITERVNTLNNTLVEKGLPYLKEYKDAINSIFKEASLERWDNNGNLIGIADVDSLNDFVNDYISSLGKAEILKTNYTKTGIEFVVQQRTEDDVINNLTITYDNLTNAITKNVTSSKQGMNKLDSALDTMKRKLIDVAKYLTSFVSVFAIWNTFKTGLTFAREFDDALTELKAVIGDANADMSDFVGTARKVADALGTTTTEVVKSSTDWRRLGYGVEDSIALAKEASKLSTTGYMDVSTATDDLTSALQAFYSDSDDIAGIASSVVDKFVNIGNEYAITTEDLANAMTGASSTLVSAGNDIDEVIAMITAGTTIMQDADTVASSLRVVSMRLRGTSENELSQLGEDTDGLIEDASKLNATIKNLTKTAKTPDGINILTDSGAYRTTYEIKILSPYKETYMLCA